MSRALFACCLLLVLALGACQSRPAVEGSVALRVATYNIEDIRTLDLLDPEQPRLQAAAALIQQVQPDVILLNEFTVDQPGDPGYTEGGIAQNGQRFADGFLAVSQGPGLEPIAYQAFMPLTNTGIASGFDLNNDGLTVTSHPPPPSTNPDGSPGPQTDGGRAYGEDAWGFGTFPGQYGMALLVREGLDLRAQEVRTFRELPWSLMPGAVLPTDPETQRPWYDGAEADAFRLSSKTHADVPVRLPNGVTVHLLISHPTPPAFDGPEARNQRRNHDEIRLWADYLDGADYLVDDTGTPGGLPPEAPFLILGDLNADPDEGNAYQNPIETFLLAHPRINSTIVPEASADGLAAYPDLDADDTAEWGLRVDYVLPSRNIHVLEGRVERPPAPDGVPVSDHFLVWLDVEVHVPNDGAR
ncbi:MAG: endonuclease/exonuclease/phosphatase family protein [Bacteroidota bacterium]